MYLGIDHQKNMEKRVAVMQPYIFPYIGYFHLINASDVFIFYDDVNFIKRGWINRNYILENGKARLFTVPSSCANINKPINETYLKITKEWRKKFFKSLEHNYKKCTYYSESINLIENSLPCGEFPASTLSAGTIIAVCDYLGLKKTFDYSSSFSPETKKTGRAERLAEITKKADSSHYINSPGGKDIYSKEEFYKLNVKISFINSKPITYCQKGIPNHISNLSIIDVLMNNSIEETLSLMKEYDLE